MPARILTAVAPDTADRVQRILAGHELRMVHNLAAAKAELARHQTDLIFVGARFDESRMFDLLEHLRRDALHRKIPVVAAIVIPTDLNPETIAGLAHSVRFYGASVFINLNDFVDDESGNARVRKIIDAVIEPMPPA